MPAFTISVPDAASLPTTVCKLLNALQGIQVRIEETDGTVFDAEVMRAFEDHGVVGLHVHPIRDMGRGYPEPVLTTTRVTSTELIQSMEVF